MRRGLDRKTLFVVNFHPALASSNAIPVTVVIATARHEREAICCILTTQNNPPSLRIPIFHWEGTKCEAIWSITWIKNCADHTQI